MSHKMEDILQQLAREIITPKFANIKQTANEAHGKWVALHHCSDNVSRMFSLFFMSISIIWTK